MSGFASFAVGFCGVCVLTGGLFLLCPPGSLERAVRYLFSLIFLFCILAALPKIGKLHIALPTADAAASQNTLSARIPEWTVRLALKNAGIEFSKITVCTDKTASDGIGITKVVIWSDESEEKIRHALPEEAGEYEIEVRHE